MPLKNGAVIKCLTVRLAFFDMKHKDIAVMHGYQEAPSLPHAPATLQTYVEPIVPTVIRISLFATGDTPKDAPDYR